MLALGLGPLGSGLPGLEVPGPPEPPGLVLPGLELPGVELPGLELPGVVPVLVLVEPVLPGEVLVEPVPPVPLPGRPELASVVVGWERPPVEVAGPDLVPGGTGRAGNPVGPELAVTLVAPASRAVDEVSAVAPGGMVTRTGEVGLEVPTPAPAVIIGCRP